MADGPAIQAAGLRALKVGQDTEKTLDLIRRFRAEDQDTPVILMGYFNPIFVYGVDRFLADARAAGVDRAGESQSVSRVGDRPSRCSCSTRWRRWLHPVGVLRTLGGSSASTASATTAASPVSKAASSRCSRSTAAGDRLPSSGAGR